MIPLVKVAMPPRERLLPALEEVLYSGMIAEGDYVYRFERQFAQQFHLPLALAMSSGTGALHVALILAGVTQGDEVITTSMTAEPTNTVILQCGAIPVFADVDPDSGNLSPESVKDLIGERTKAIIVVHYAGFPARLRELRAIADYHGLPLIEDAAHSLGSKYDGVGIGGIGDYGIFSLQAIKHMTTVDGGILTFKNDAQGADARKLRWFGMAKGVPRTEVDIKVPGFKYNMHNVSGAIGIAQLESISERIAKHIANGSFFDEKISAIPGLAVTKFDTEAKPSYWLYTILSDQSEAIERKMAEIGVAASKLHRPNHHHTVFAPMRRSMPGLDTYYRRLTHIPCGWWLDEEMRDKIVETLRKG